MPIEKLSCNDNPMYVLTMSTVFDVLYYLQVAFLNGTCDYVVATRLKPYTLM